MSAYGFEENYAKAWPEGAAPGKGTRRVHDCGKLKYVDICNYILIYMFTNNITTKTTNMYIEELDHSPFYLKIQFSHL